MLAISGLGSAARTHLHSPHFGHTSIRPRRRSVDFQRPSQEASTAANLRTFVSTDSRSSASFADRRRTAEASLFRCHKSPVILEKHPLLPTEGHSVPRESHLRSIQLLFCDIFAFRTVEGRDVALRNSAVKTSVGSSHVRARRPKMKYTESISSSLFSELQESRREI